MWQQQNIFPKPPHAQAGASLIRIACRCQFMAEAITLTSTQLESLPDISTLLWYESSSVSNLGWLQKLSNFFGNFKKQCCCVLGKTLIGADGHFWVKTRFGILVKGSCIWANQVWSRANLPPKKWKCPPKKPYRCSPTRWGVFWQKVT